MSAPELLKPAARDQMHPVIRWLMSDARSQTEPSEFPEAFAQRLLAAGVDVSRITGVLIPHPLIFFFSGLWQQGKGTTELRYRAGSGREGEFAILADRS